MGICLDTEQSEGSQAFEEGRETWVENSARNPRAAATPLEGQFPMHNATAVQFESPKVPVIFVLGGPGSGKVTHCDNLMQEKNGITHINMTDLLQQYAIGNDGRSSLINTNNIGKEMQDFSVLSSKTVTEVLMLEMKMAPAAKTYLISGYPRSMRDVVEYSEKIQIINGVILISWRQKVLERQIDYGAKLGQVVLSLARMELNNFYKNVMPVADYFDQNNMLIAVNGERHPGDVYKDFRASVMKILGMQDNPPVFSDGREATVPPDVSTELPNVVRKHLTPRRMQRAIVSFQQNKSKNSVSVSHVPKLPPEPIRPQTQVLSVNPQQKTAEYQAPVKVGWPPVLWIIGGPGSNKGALCDQAAKETGWAHISLGKLLRAAAESPDKRQGSDAVKIRESIAAGDMVSLDIVMKMVESHMGANLTAPGIILDGFPRDINQATEFESKFKQKPTIILLDCSKLQLGRGRLDDSVTAFRRRLEIFRQSSLPMLKTMDNIGRLTIVDGDTDTVPVQEDFKNVVKEHIQYLTDSKEGENTQISNGHAIQNGYALPMANGHVVANGHVPRKTDATLHDLETESTVQTISKNVSNGVASVVNGTIRMVNGHLPVKAPGVGNAVVRNKYDDLNADRQDNIRNMYAMDGHI